MLTRLDFNFKNAIRQISSLWKTTNATINKNILLLSVHGPPRAIKTGRLDKRKGGYSLEKKTAKYDARE